MNYQASSKKKSELSEKINELVKEFKKNPRNKTFVTWDLLLDSAEEELGESVDPEELKKVFAAVVDVTASEKDYQLYDAAMSVVGNVAAECFFDGNHGTGYSYCLLETEDGFNVEIRP